AGKCTLRDAIQASNTSTDVNGCAFGGGPYPRIVFGVTGRIRLSADALAPSTSVLIDGPGATQLTITGERKYRVLESGDRTPDKAFGVAGVTIANGRLGADVGGGVDFAFQPSALAIDAVAFEDDFAFGGGGALDAQYSRTVEVDSSSFSSTVARTGSG